MRNIARASRAERALRHASYEQGDDGLTDLLTDLRHLAIREGWDFERSLAAADDHFACEVADSVEY